MGQVGSYEASSLVPSMHSCTLISSYRLLILPSFALYVGLLVSELASSGLQLACVLPILEEESSSRIPLERVDEMTLDW